MSILGDVGNFLTGGHDETASADLSQATQGFKDVALPDFTQMQQELDGLVQQGVLTPEQATAYIQQQSDMNNIKLDPADKQAQEDALNSLQQIGQSGGMTAADKANLSQINTNEQTTQRGARDAILQNAQARGLGGSGIELLSQMQNQQDSATRQNQQDLTVAGQAQTRALQALQSAGTLGGQIENTDFSQQAATAQANDAINKFNAQNQQQVNETNVTANNAASAANLAEKQRLNDTKIAASNNLAQQQFDDTYKKAAGVSNALTGQATNEMAQGAVIPGLIGTAASAAATAGSKSGSDENLKKDVEEFDPSDFLDNLTGYKYNYKDPEKFGDGPQVGVMAQDLEKGAPQMVEDTPDGKIVDYNKAGGPIMASLASLNDRLKQLEGKDRA